MTSAATIAAALGMQQLGRLFTGQCPACGYAGAFTAEDRDGRPLVHCHGCGDQAAVLDALRHRGLWGGIERCAPPPPFLATHKADHSEYARRVWSETRPAEGTAVERYLQSRGIAATVPATLRFHPGLKHSPTGLLLPAMVAAVTVWPSRTVTAIHRTWLKADGSGKAPVTPDKMTLGPLAGGAIRLNAAGDVLVVAEGIETALSAMMVTGLPAWSCISAGGMAAATLPDTVREVIVAADNDANGVGQAAADTAANRWVAEGRRVRIALPPTIGTDWNDVLRERAA